MKKSREQIEAELAAAFEKFDKLMQPLPPNRPPPSPPKPSLLPRVLPVLLLVLLTVWASLLVAGIRRDEAAESRIPPDNDFSFFDAARIGPPPHIRFGEYREIWDRDDNSTTNSGPTNSVK
jgi:hypothetical protein